MFRLLPGRSILGYDTALSGGWLKIFRNDAASEFRVGVFFTKVKNHAYVSFGT
jgi:hypothetical protein